MKKADGKRRTLLIIEINQESNSFLQRMSDVEHQLALSDEQVEKLEEALLVRNIEEFDKKFPIKATSALPKEHEAVQKQNRDEQEKLAEAIRTYGQHQYEIWYEKEQVISNEKHPNLLEEQCKKLEIRLGVKFLLEQRCSELLVLNVSPDELAEQRNLEKLKLYLNTVNQKKETRSSIQFAILPEVEFAVKQNHVDRKRFPGKEKIFSNQAVSSEVAKKLIHVMGENHIVTFLQYVTAYETSAQAFAQKGIAPYQNEGYQYEHTPFSNYLSCCFPNLTMEEGKLYLGAAYVAAGILSGSTKEEQECTLPRELYPYSVQTEEEIEKERYGCVLVSEYREKSKGNHMILLSARTMSRKAGEYEKLEMVLEECNVL